MKLYDVEVEGIGTVQTMRRTIAEARGWARAAFGPTAKVTAHPVYRLCGRCDCAPCCCRKKSKD